VSPESRQAPTKAARSGTKPVETGAKAAASPEHDRPMTIWEHLTELRKRLIYALIAWVGGCVAGWSFREPLLAILVEPFAVAWRAQKIGPEVTLHFATPGAAFVAYMKLAMLGGTALASPVIFYHLWRFIAPALYAREKRFVIPFVVVSTGLFVGGGYFGWKAAFPVAFGYLLSLSGTVGTHGVTIVPTVMMGEYISFVTSMLLGFGVIFEIPVLVFFLSVAGVVNYLHLVHYARWFILVAFIVAAVLTPPDVASQLVMAIPMVVLYGGSIFVAMIFGKKPTTEQRQAYARKRKSTRAPA
jgi:sec-independent protein translocase protein TatC